MHKPKYFDLIPDNVRLSAAFPSLVTGRNKQGQEQQHRQPQRRSSRRALRERPSAPLLQRPPRSASDRSLARRRSEGIGELVSRRVTYFTQVSQVSLAIYDANFELSDWICKNFLENHYSNLPIKYYPNILSVLHRNSTRLDFDPHRN